MLLRRRLQILSWLSLELRFAACAAKQHFFTILSKPVRRIWLDDHAANGIADLFSLRGMIVLKVLIHGAHADCPALLI